jgi:hypothetical protein
MDKYENDTLHWLWTTKMQIARFANAFNNSMLVSKNLVARKNLKLLESDRRIYSQSSAEAHFLIIAANNLKKALRKIDGVGNVNNEIMGNIEILRNNLEHWETNQKQFENINNKKEKSAKSYADKYPNRTPWSFSWDANGLVIGGIVKVDNLLKELDKLEKRIQSMQNRK